jgi:uncharacterized membrane protein
MNRRLAIAILALAGFFISLYLQLFKIGMIGTIACGTGGCETVQLSPQSRFLGVDVALIGVIGYLIILGTGMAALTPRFAGWSWPVRVLPWLTGGAVLFTLYLKYLEFFVVRAICRWCVASAVIIVTVFGLSVAEWWRERATAR